MIYKINTQFLKYSTGDSLKTLLDELELQKDEITTLDLSLNTFVPQLFVQICKKIKIMTNLKHVILESILDSLTFEEMCEIMDALGESLPLNLESLELPSNALSCNFPDKFATYLSCAPLKVLSLHNCGLGEDGLKRVISCLSKVENKNNLISLDLSKNRINVICPECSEVLSQYTNLTKLILNANTIEEKSMGAFLEHLNNKELEFLNLTDNFVCGKAIDALGDVYTKNNISELYLQDIKVDNGDINRLLTKMNERKSSSLPGGIENIKPFLTLDISCNFFDQECIDLLKDLTEKVIFKKLMIFDNDYEDCEELRKTVVLNGGRVIEDEEEEEYDPLDEDIIEKITGL